MISRINNLLRSIFISPEIVVGLVLCLISQSCHSWVDAIGQWYFEQGNWAIGIASFGILVFSASLVMDILFPSKDMINHLKDWPDYLKLKDTVFLGLAWCLIGAVGGLMLFILRAKTPVPLIGLFFLESLCIPLVSAIALFMAKVNIRFILAQEPPLNSHK